MDQIIHNREQNFLESWAQEETRNYYSSHRCSLNEIYDSERFFLSKLVTPKMNVLDVGCAAGGFSTIFKEIEPSVQYTGIDISMPLIKEAAHKYSDNSFVIGEGSHLPFNAGHFDLVFCSGVLHMTLNWRDVIRECWRVAKNFLIFDVRLIEKGSSIEDPLLSYQKLSFNDQWDGKSIVPYIVLTLPDFQQEITQLTPKVQNINVYGYFNKVSNTAITPYEEVCMTMWCLSKQKIEGCENIWMLPIK